jgi:HSP20 family protein
MSLFNSILPSRRNGAQADRTEAPATVKPAYEVRETDEAYGVTVHLPGVSRDTLEITAEDGTVRITGRRPWKAPEGWACLHRETTGLPYELVLTHDNAIDADKIAAELRDGVLHVSLPKHEATKPRRIAVS